MSKKDSKPELPSALAGFPSSAIEAFYSYESSRSAADLKVFLLAALDFLLERPEEDSLADLPQETRLMEDLGADSLLVAELVFLLEDLFGIQLANEDLSEVKTLGDLQKMIELKAADR